MSILFSSRVNNPFSIRVDHVENELERNLRVSYGIDGANSVRSVVTEGPPAKLTGSNPSSSSTIRAEPQFSGTHPRRREHRRRRERRRGVYGPGRLWP